MQNCVKYIVIFNFFARVHPSGQLTNDIYGKYLQFNSVNHENLNADFPVWFRALKESTLIALEGDSRDNKLR